MREILSIALLSGVVAANAQVTMFNSSTVANNAATEAAWLTAAGIAAPQFVEDFESYTVGTSLHGVALVGGAVITDTNATPNMTVQSASSFFGGSVPFGQGLRFVEGRTYNFTFAIPTSYVALYDLDQGGSDLRIFLSDSTFVDFNNLDDTASSGSSGEFLGFVSTGPAITAIQFGADGGDGEMGIDNLQYGAVPEPATMILLGLGSLAVARKRRK